MSLSVLVENMGILGGSLGFESHDQPAQDTVSDLTKLTIMEAKAFNLGYEPRESLDKRGLSGISE